MLPVRGLAIAYIDVMRGIPLLLVILLISGSLPFLDFLPMWLRAPDFFGKPDIFWYGVMSITLTYGAYYAEVYRAGLEAVPYGQMEAARSLGMSHAQAMRHVIVPQAIRKVIPPMLNDFIALMKDTSLVGVIALVEVVKAGREVQAETFNSSALTLGALMFVVVTIPLARLVDRLIARQQLACATRRDGAIAAPAEARTADGPMLRLEGVHKSFGELHVLRGVEPRGRPRRRRLRDRPERLRQEHAAALHQPARAARQGPDLPRGQGDHRQPAAADIDFVRRRVGMVFQQFNLFPHKRAIENVTLAQQTVLGRSAEEARAQEQGAARARRAWPTRSTSTRSGCRAASSSGSRSRGRSRWTRT